jgi:hypothetical protein
LASTDIDERMPDALSTFTPTRLCQHPEERFSIRERRWPEKLVPEERAIELDVAAVRQG